MYPEAKLDLSDPVSFVVDSVIAEGTVGPVDIY